MEIGKIVTYRGQGIYKVLAKEVNSRTLLTIKDIDKGKGWCEATKKYIGVAIPNGWYRGQNNDYGIELIGHIKNLKEIPNEEI